MKSSSATGAGCFYLDCAVVRPGDILLSAATDTVSKVIRGATRGPYSHAALIFGPTVRLEADGDGTGYTTMFYSRVEQLTNPRRGRFLHLLPSSTQRAVVLRRPGLAESIPDLSHVLSELARPFLWKEYPQLCRLASVFNQDAVKKASIQPFLRILDKAIGATPSNPGLFCSQLVAAIYETVSHPLILGVPADEISPNAIFERAGLQEVADAITVPDESAEIDEGRLQVLNATMGLQFSRAVLPGLVEFMALVERLKKRAEEWN